MMNSESHFLSPSHVSPTNTSPYTPLKGAGCPNRTPKRSCGQGLNTPRCCHPLNFSTSDTQLLLPELEFLSEASISVRALSLLVYTC
jgi:hypothetical protein